MRFTNKIDNINLIRKIAWSFHKTTGIEWEELFSEALYKYILLLKECDLEENVNKGKISTHIWVSLSNCLKTYIKQHGKIHQPLEVLNNIDEMDWNSYNGAPFWENLTDEAHGVANLILKYSEHFVCLTPEQVKDRVTKILSNLGWSIEKINAGLSDLEKACN